MKNPVGRPKTLDREKLINIAYQEYWCFGINNVSLSKIANLAAVSRPGIYKEFTDEDGLKSEVLKNLTLRIYTFFSILYHEADDLTHIF